MKLEYYGLEVASPYVGMTRKQDSSSNQCTVEPLYNGHVCAGAFCPLYGGVLYREVQSIIAF